MMTDQEQWISIGIALILFVIGMYLINNIGNKK